MPKPGLSWLRGCLALAAFSAAAQAEPKPAVVVVVHGGDAFARRAREELVARSDLPVEVRVASLPNTPQPPVLHPAQEARLAVARKRYTEALFSECLSELADDAPIESALARGQRVEAARLLLWRVACNVGIGRQRAAQREAMALAVRGLEIPADIATTSPEVEVVLAEALKEAAGAPRLPLRVEANVAGARVSIDGRPPSCVVPCVVPLPAGEHTVQVEADGMKPVTRSVYLRPPGASASLELSSAPPEDAAEQWSARYAQGNAIDSPSSVRLLSTALRASRLALIAVEPEGEGVRLRGAVSVDGEIAARSERLAAGPGDMPGSTSILLSDLLVRGKVVEPAPPLYARPLFWVAVGGTAVGAALLTAFLVRPTTVRAQVSF